MKYLIVIILALFLGQSVVSSVSSFWSDDQNEYVLDIEQEDGESDSEDPFEDEREVNDHFDFRLNYLALNKRRDQSAQDYYSSNYDDVMLSITPPPPKCS